MVDRFQNMRFQKMVEKYKSQEQKSLESLGEALNLEETLSKLTKEYEQEGNQETVDIIKRIMPKILAHHKDDSK